MKVLVPSLWRMQHITIEMNSFLGNYSRGNILRINIREVSDSLLISTSSREGGHKGSIPRSHKKKGCGLFSCGIVS
jgi:hypothetical protein